MTIKELEKGEFLLGEILPYEEVIHIIQSRMEAILKEQELKEMWVDTTVIDVAREVKDLYEIYDGGKEDVLKKRLQYDLITLYENIRIDFYQFFESRKSEFFRF